MRSQAAIVDLSGTEPRGYMPQRFEMQTEVLKTNVEFGFCNDKSPHNLKISYRES